MLEELFLKSREFVALNNQTYKRYFIMSQSLEHRLSIIIGPRGIGKTTTIAQYMSANYKEHEALYVNLDDITTSSQFTMTDIAELVESIMTGSISKVEEKVTDITTQISAMKAEIEKKPEPKVDDETVAENEKLKKRITELEKKEKKE
jgi:Ni2+-binding GTPase involved in maturation of urease and hydrogenase